MPDAFAAKSTPEEIRARFDAEVERFSDLDGGQKATMDAPLIMSLVAGAAAGVCPSARGVLDIGCGAGNYTLKLLAALGAPAAGRVAVTLVDLSDLMLDRAAERIEAVGVESVTPIRGDVRTIDLGEARYDIVVAAAVLHHLRGDDEWRAVYAKVFRSLRRGGSFWVADLVDHDEPAVRKLMWERYDAYLIGVGGVDYRNQVRAYIDREDTPRSLSYQLALMRDTGFHRIAVLHKHACFAAFGGVRP